MCDPCDIAAFYKVCLSSFHLNGVVLPFWEDWGDACPSMFLTPDALHQWHTFYYNHCIVETCTSLCLYSTPSTFHPTALLLSLHSELPFSC